MPRKCSKYVLAVLGFAFAGSCGNAEPERPVWEAAPVLMCRELYSTLCIYDGGADSLNHTCSRVTGRAMWRIDFQKNALKHFESGSEETLLSRSSRDQGSDGLESVVVLSTQRMLRFVRNTKAEAAGRKNVYLAMRFSGSNTSTSIPMLATTEISECVPPD